MSTSFDSFMKAGSSDRQILVSSLPMGGWGTSLDGMRDGILEIAYSVGLTEARIICRLSGDARATHLLTCATALIYIYS